jgi:hypothetical protein
LVNAALSGRIGRVQRRPILRDGPRNEIIDRQRLGYAERGMPVTELPMTGVGKVDKKVLKAGFWAGRERMVG